MFGIRAKLPVSEERRVWVNDGFTRFSQWLGRDRMAAAKVYLPIADDFPDEYAGDEPSAKRMMERIAAAMGIDPAEIDLEIFPDETEGLRGDLPLPGIHGAETEGTPQHAAGLYFGATEQEARTIIALKSSQLKNPMSLVATLSHELSHQILLGRKFVARDAEDMEPLTDLLTVFLGFGVFNANSAFQFQQFNKGGMQGWSAGSLGYLSEQTYGYALARFAWERREAKPVWAKYLAVNVRHYFDSSAKWLEQNEPR